MSFSKKIIAGVAAVATLAALAPAVAMANTAQNQNSATSTQAEEEFATVTFYAADGHSIQGVTWQKGTAFSHRSGVRGHRRIRDVRGYPDTG